MGDQDRSASRASASADFLEWNFKLMADGSPWSVEQGMTQLLAHQNAEGFGPALDDAARADAEVILALIDRTLNGGLFRELSVGADLDVIRRTTEESDEFVSTPLDPAYGRRLLEDALVTSDELIENRPYKPRPVPVAYRKMRALTLARARALSDVAAPAEPFPGTVEIELLKRTFLASGAASGLPADEATRQAVDVLVAHFVEEAGCHPLDLGPRRVLAVLGLPSLAADTMDNPAVGRVLPDVATAWVSWTAAERGLPGAAAERLEQAARQACAGLRPGNTADRETT